MQDIAEELRNAVIKMVEKAERKIGYIMRSGTRKDKIKAVSSIKLSVENVQLYLMHVDEAYKELMTQITEHKRDPMCQKLSHLMVIHAESEGHLPKWEDVEEIKTKHLTEILESAVISITDCTITEVVFRNFEMSFAL